MAELRDPAIKLFGRTIPLADPPPPPPQALRAEVPDPPATDLDSGEPSSSGLANGIKDDHQGCDQEDETVLAVAADSKKEGEADSVNQEKTALKKPDRILPCPRCNSLDTKFCYFNNYNVNQPRHFCRNCQRYWTAGGTMRNVPVGAGRRKNKHTMHFRHPDAPNLMNPDLPCGPSLPPQQAADSVKPEEMAVLKFSSPDVPLCNSMANMLNIAEQKNPEFKLAPCDGGGREEESCASSVAASNSLKDGVMPQGDNNVQMMPQMPWHLGAALMFPWGPGWTNIAAMAATRLSSELTNGKPGQVSWPMTSAPQLLPFPVMPPSFWGNQPIWPNGMWGVPSQAFKAGALSPTSNSSSSGNASPTLGKHCRDAASLHAEGGVDNNLWVPKTLRVGDPDEAAKSSIWATLGIKPDEGCVFKTLEMKSGKHSQSNSESAHVLKVNPAALSRSQSFQEST